MPTLPQKKHKLTPKRERFCQEYSIDFNASAAARRAGFKEHAAGQMGYDLLKLPEIQARIMVLRAEDAKKFNITKESLMQILRDIAGANLEDILDAEGNVLPLNEWPENMKRVTSGMEVDEMYTGQGDNRQAIGVRRKIKLSERTKAIELLNKMLGFNAPEKIAPVTPDGEALQVPVINIITRTSE